jgi:hypothetical protein
VACFKAVNEELNRVTEEIDKNLVYTKRYWSKGPAYYGGTLATTEIE